MTFPQQFPDASAPLGRSVPGPAGVRPQGEGWLAAAPILGKLPWAVWVLCACLFLITVFGKGPTYLGVPPLFIGEIALGVSLLWVINRHGLYRAMLADESLLACLVALFMALGAVLTSLCVGEYGINAIRDAAIWYYGLFYCIGHALGREEALGNRVWRSLVIAWGFAAVWGTFDQLLQLTVGWGVSTFPPILPWRGESLFFNSNYEEIQQIGLAGLVILHPRLHQGHLGKWQPALAWVALLALALVAVAHGRGVKVGMAMGALLVAILHFAPGRPMQISQRSFVALLVLVLLALGGVMLLGEDFLTATKLDRFTEANPADAGGTAFWRLIWWKILWREVNDLNPLFGLGFGQSLSFYNPYLIGDEATAWPVRSPHNFNITVFTRMGFVGAAIWLALLTVGVGSLFLRAWRGTVQGVAMRPERREEIAFWIVFLVATWGNGTFGVLMEGPVLGIWFWFALGFAHARSTSGSAQPQAAASSYGSIGVMA